MTIEVLVEDDPLTDPDDVVAAAQFAMDALHVNPAAELCIRFEEDDGVRRETWATSFVVFWHDQFGTRCAAVQAPGENLLGILHEDIVRQLLEAEPDLRSHDAPSEFEWQPDDDAP